MKACYLLFCLLLLNLSGYAQSYYYFETTGSDPGFVFNDPNMNEILTEPAGDTLSAAQILPFPFNFYGSPVTAYKASDNGYITFDTSQTVSYAVNDSPPTAGMPNHAIYAFWMDLGLIVGAGAPDRVVNWTYGTAPNRVHVVEWFSVTSVAAGAGFLYAVILIHEDGNLQIIHNYANSTNTSATVGVENIDGTDATLVAGSPNMTMGLLNDFSNDDIVYNFIHGTQPDFDAVVDSTGVITGFPVAPLRHVQAWNGFAGRIFNVGKNDLTNVKLHVQITNQGNVVFEDSSASISTILAGENAVATTTNSYTPTDTGTHFIHHFAKAAEADGDPTNDTAVINLVVSDSSYARDNGVANNPLGVGAGLFGAMGQLFELLANDTLSSITAFLMAPVLGDSMTFSIYNYNGSFPDSQPMVTSNLIMVADTNPHFVTGMFDPPVALTPGNYLMALNESYTNVAGIAVSLGIFTPRTVFVTWTGQPWIPVDTLPNSTLHRPYMLRANFRRGGVVIDPCADPLVVQVISIDSATTGMSDGSISIQVTGGTPPYQYGWNPGSGTDVISDIPAGTYNLVVTDSNGCTVDEVFTVPEKSPHLDYANFSHHTPHINVYPNPSDGSLRVTGNIDPGSDVLLEVFDLTGRTVYRENLSGHSGINYQIDLNTVGPGAYFIRLKAKNLSHYQRFSIVE